MGNIHWHVQVYQFRITNRWDRRWILQRPLKNLHLVRSRCVFLPQLLDTCFCFLIISSCHKTSSGKRGKSSKKIIIFSLVLHIMISRDEWNHFKIRFKVSWKCFLAASTLRRSLATGMKVGLHLVGCAPSWSLIQTRLPLNTTGSAGCS